MKLLHRIFAPIIRGLRLFWLEAVSRITAGIGEIKEIDTGLPSLPKHPKQAQDDDFLTDYRPFPGFGDGEELAGLMMANPPQPLTEPTPTATAVPKRCPVEYQPEENSPGVVELPGNRNNLTPGLS